MTSQALKQLGQNALTWAKTYRDLTEALMGEGVTEEQARIEARNAANFAACMPGELYEEEKGDPCPVCGRQS